MKKQINFHISKGKGSRIFKMIMNPERYGCKVNLTFEDKDGNIYGPFNNPTVPIFKIEEL